jgi:hypothetical protein
MFEKGSYYKDARGTWLVKVADTGRDRLEATCVFGEGLGEQVVLPLRRKSLDVEVYREQGFSGHGRYKSRYDTGVVRRNSSYYKLLGVLLSGRARLTVFASASAEQSLRYDYRDDAHCELPSKDVYLGENKWGRESRVTLRGRSVADLRLLVLACIPAGDVDIASDSVVNSNVLVRCLWQDGFILGVAQSESKVRARVPDSFVLYFEEGLAYGLRT